MAEAGDDPRDTPATDPTGTLEQPATPGDPDPEPYGDETASFLSNLPDDLRERLEGADQGALDTLRKQTMLRSDYDRKRGEESETLRRMELELAELRGHVAARPEPEVPQGPTLDELGKTMFETRDPDEFAESLQAFTATVAQQAAAQALEGDPTIRKVRRAEAIHTARAGTEDVTDEDWVAGLEAIETDMANQGVDPQRVHPGVIKLLAPQAAKAASLQRQLEEAQNGQAATRRRTPRREPTGGAAATPPAAGAGSEARTTDPKANPYADPNSTLDDRLNYLLEKNNLTREDLSRMHREGAWGV